MKYLILLEDRNNGREALIECNSNMILEDLSVKIKIEMRLPLRDDCRHRFLFKGKTYVVNEHVEAEPKGLEKELGFYPAGYRSSERVRLKQLYTVKGSAITYLQDGKKADEHKIRCTLIARVP